MLYFLSLCKTNLGLVLQDRRPSTSGQKFFMDFSAAIVGMNRWWNHFSIYPTFFWSSINRWRDESAIFMITSIRTCPCVHNSFLDCFFMFFQSISPYSRNEFMERELFVAWQGMIVRCGTKKLADRAMRRKVFVNSSVLRLYS